MKIFVQRLVKMWIEENYDVENINESTIKDVIDYKFECNEFNPIWDTQEDSGEVEVFDSNNKLIYKQYE